MQLWQHPQKQRLQKRGEGKQYSYGTTTALIDRLAKDSAAHSLDVLPLDMLSAEEMLM